MQIDQIPYGVKKTLAFFESRGLWCNIARNHEARSCKDAANKRNRLGHEGIFLADELKSFFGKMINASGQEQYLVIHCRGNDKLDWQKVKELLNLNEDIIRLSSEELAVLFNLDYGLVNPFTLDPIFLGSPILQVFDKQIFEKRLPPYSMTTNAGDLTYSVEFKPEELIKLIDNQLIGNIVIEKNYHHFRHEKIGILTGNGPESGLFLWNEINERIRKDLANQFSGDISFPPVILESLPEMGLSMELDKREKDTWDAVKKGIISLCKQGATICCIACNTTQYFTPQIKEICEQFKTKFISIPEALEKYLKQNGIAEFDFLGIKFVTDFEKWSAFKYLENEFKVTLPDLDDLGKINELAFKVKQDGITGQGINKLRDLLSKSAKTNNVVIALTELSILMSAQKKNKSEKNFIDTLKILANAVADEYISKTYSFIEEEDLGYE